MLFLTLPVAAEDNLPADARADRVVVMKKERTLTLMSGDRVLKTLQNRSRWRPGWTQAAGR